MRLCLKDINVSFGDNQVLKNINFEVSTKDKVAIVGRNGSGKTTLLKVITGEQEIDISHQDTIKDKIQKTGNFCIGYLKQIAFEDDQETFEVELLKAYKDILSLKDEIEKLESLLQTKSDEKTLVKYEEMLRNFDIIGGYTYQKEYNLAIKKFGFTDEDKNKKLCEFSGGQRTKIALLKLLLTKPDLLILDEPTNHLDITSIKWLEEYLADYSKAVIVVSHDRAFLDRFVNIVYEIERNKIKKYIGNYTQFAKTKELNYEKDLKEYKAHVDEKARLQAVADRFRYKATKASMAQSKLKQIERMGEIPPPENADTRVFSTNITPNIESSHEVVFADDIEIGYDRTLSKISFKIFKEDRVGIVGGNGLGKSTLLKSLVDKIPLIKGKIKWGTNIEIGYFDQQSATENIANESILENYQKTFPEETIQSARNMLGAFCFSQDDVFKNLRDLSGGERVRYELCKILQRKPNVLILDEPTNHLDIMGKEALEKMLLNYKGTIIFVSHDRYFVNKIATSLIVFENSNSRFLKDTSYNEYEKQIDKEIPSVIEKPLIKKEEKKEVNSYFLSKEKARNDAKRKKLEGKIDILEKEINQLKERLNLPEIYSDYIKIQEIQNEIDNKNNELDLIMTEWLNLSE